MFVCMKKSWTRPARPARHEKDTGVMFDEIKSALGPSALALVFVAMTYAAIALMCGGVA